MPTLPRYESKGELTTQPPSQMSRTTLAGKDAEAVASGAMQVQSGVEKWGRAYDSMKSTQAEYNLKTSLMDIEQRMELDPDKNNAPKYLQEVNDAYNKSGAADTKAKLELDLVRQAMNYKVVGTFKKKQIDSDRANTAEMIAMEVANPTPYSETYIQDLLAEKTKNLIFSDTESQKLEFEARKDIRMNNFLREFRNDPVGADKKFGADGKDFGFTIEEAEKARSKMREITRMNRESQTANVAEASLRLFNGDLTENEIDSGIAMNERDASLGYTAKQGAKLKESLYKDISKRIGVKEFEKQRKSIDYIFADSKQDRMTMYEAVLNAHKDGVTPDEARFLQKIVDMKKDVVFAQKAAAGKKFLETLLGAKAIDVEDQTKNLLIYAQRISNGSSPEEAAQETAFDIIKKEHPAVVGDPDLAGTFSPTKGFRPVTKVKRDESSTGKGR